MAIAKYMNWYIRAGGDELNGGGYDGTTYAGGVNYADQDAAQLSLSDLTSSASTTVTSSTGGFTANMVGNVLRLASGSGATTGYYVIAAYTDTHTITLDRASGTYTAGVGKIGGAHAVLIQYANGGGGTQPTLASPLAAGHTINVRGAGTDDPSTPDYVGSPGYWQYPSGDPTGTSGDGAIKLKGYNGRPYYTGDILLWGGSGWSISHMKFGPISGGSYTTSLGLCNFSGSKFRDIIYDQVGLGGVFLGGGASNCIIGCEFRNSGGGSYSGTFTVQIANHGNAVLDSYFHNLTGHAIYVGGQYANHVHGCIIANNLGHGIIMNDASPSTNQGVRIWNNTIDNNGLDGINVPTPEILNNCLIYNNIITNHTTSGHYGINVVTSSTALSDFIADGGFFNNNVWNNDTNYHNISTGANDLSIDPQFTNPSTGDYSIAGAL